METSFKVAKECLALISKNCKALLIWLFCAKSLENTTDLHPVSSINPLHSSDRRYSDHRSSLSEETTFVNETFLASGEQGFRVETRIYLSDKCFGNVARSWN